MLSRLSPSKSYRTRDLGYLRHRADLSDGVLMLNCARGRKALETAYDVQSDYDESGAIRTVYLAKRDDETGSVYGVEFDPATAAPARCNCSGFGRWKDCKHIVAVTELHRCGELATS